MEGGEGGEGGEGAVAQGAASGAARRAAFRQDEVGNVSVAYWKGMLRARLANNSFYLSDQVATTSSTISREASRKELAVSSKYTAQCMARALQRHRTDSLRAPLTRLPQPRLHSLH